MSISVSVPARLRRASRRRVAARHLAEESVAGAVAKFALAAFVAVVVIGLGGVVVIRHTASNEVLRDSKDLARLAGNGVVAPHLTPSMLHGDPSALAPAIDKLEKTPSLTAEADALRDDLKALLTQARDISNDQSLQPRERDRRKRQLDAGLDAWNEHFDEWVEEEGRGLGIH